MWTYFVHMKKVTVRDLRNSFSRIEVWLAEGEEVLIEKRGKPIASLTGWKDKENSHLAFPDFESRRKSIWGEKVFSEEEVQAMRAAELEGEEG